MRGKNRRKQPKAAEVALVSAQGGITGDNDLQPSRDRILYACQPGGPPRNRKQLGREQLKEEDEYEEVAETAISKDLDKFDESPTSSWWTFDLPQLDGGPSDLRLFKFAGPVDEISIYYLHKCKH